MTTTTELILAAYDRERPATTVEAMRRLRNFALKRAVDLNEFVSIDAAISLLFDTILDQQFNDAIRRTRDAQGPAPTRGARSEVPRLDPRTVQLRRGLRGSTRPRYGRDS